MFQTNISLISLLGVCMTMSQALSLVPSSPIAMLTCREATLDCSVVSNGFSAPSVIND